MQIRCSQCRRVMGCNPDGPCWCKSVKPVPIVENTDCVCSNCLEDRKNNTITFAREIVSWRDPILGENTRPIEIFSSQLQGVSLNMLQLMNGKRKGVGLAANQVGWSLRMFVMMLPDQPLLVACNPILTLKGLEEISLEGCLSYPDKIRFMIRRSEKVDMIYQDLLGKYKSIELEGLGARVAQHEMDHLCGILPIDRVSRQQKRAIERELEKLSGRQGVCNCPA